MRSLKIILGAHLSQSSFKVNNKYVVTEYAGVGVSDTHQNLGNLGTAGYLGPGKFWVPIGTGQKKILGPDGYLVTARENFLGTDGYQVPARENFFGTP